MPPGKGRNARPSIVRPQKIEGLALCFYRQGNSTEHIQEEDHIMKRFIADASFWELFPDAAIGVLAVTGINEETWLSPEQAAEVAELLKSANCAALSHLDEGVALSQNRAVAVWREAYQKFPTKKGARCSIEALLKRVSKGEPVGTIAPTVDITNAISLKYALPIGAEDMDAFEGDLHLGVMAGGEDFLPIGADEPDPPRPGELAYYDGAGVVCRCWNWRDGRRTAVKDTTTAEFIAMECVDPGRVDDLENALTELAGLLEKYTGAKVMSRGLVDSASREIMIQA